MIIKAYCCQLTSVTLQISVQKKQYKSTQKKTKAELILIVRPFIYLIQGLFVEHVCMKVVCGIKILQKFQIINSLQNVVHN